MDPTTALLRIAARVTAATAALVAEPGGEAPVAAWGCDESSARALLRVLRDEPKGSGTVFAALPIVLADGTHAQLVLVAPDPAAPREVLERLATEIGSSLDPRKPAENDALARFTEAIDQMGEAMAIVKLPASVDDAPTFVHVNVAFGRLFGWDPHDLAGASGDFYFGPQTDRDRIRWARTLLLDGQETRMVAVLYTQDGSPLWCEMSLAPLAATRGSHYVCTFRDVTSRKQFEDALGAEKRKLQTTLAAIADAVVTVLADGRIEFVNGAAQRLLGIDLVDAYGAQFNEMVPLVDAEGRSLDVLAGIDAEGRRGEGHLRTKNGTADVQYVASRIGTSDAHSAVVVLRDVTAEHRLALKLSFEASHDPLTGLPNRRAFLERLETAVATARELGGHHAVAFLDLDRFKVVNDRFGHAAGDRLLREIARVMGRVVRGGDVLARIGGDEFALLLSDCRIDDARRVAEKMRRAVDAYRIEDRGEVLGVGVSIGLAPIDGETINAAHALGEADAACYQAKASGRNVVAG